MKFCPECAAPQTTQSVVANVQDSVVQIEKQDVPIGLEVDDLDHSENDDEAMNERSRTPTEEKFLDKSKPYSQYVVALFVAMVVVLLIFGQKSELYNTNWQDSSGNTRYFHESGNYFVNDQLIGTWSTSDGDTRVTIELPEVDPWGDHYTYSYWFYVVGDVLFIQTISSLLDYQTCYAYVNVEIPLSNIEQKMDEVIRPDACWLIDNWD